MYSFFPQTVSYLLIFYSFMLYFNSFVCNAEQTIKLWKVGSRKSYCPQAVNSYKSTNKLQLPQKNRLSSYSEDSDVEIRSARTKKVFRAAHAYHINSLSVNSDNQTFISGDDLRINWWNLENCDTCFSELIPLFYILKFFRHFSYNSRHRGYQT